jgi:hypothetical protein
MTWLVLACGMFKEPNIFYIICRYRCYGFYRQMYEKKGEEEESSMFPSG